MRPALLLALLLATLVGVLMTAATTVPPPMPCMDTDTKERARALMLESVDEALKRQTMHLYENSLKDPADAASNRFARGMNNALINYVRWRGLALTWSPPLCQ